MKSPNNGKKAFVKKGPLLDYLNSCGDEIDSVLLQKVVNENKIYRSTSKRKYKHGFFVYSKCDCRCDICRLASVVCRKYRINNKNITYEFIDEIANTCVNEYINDNSPQHREFYKYIEARFNIHIKKADDQNKTKS